MADELRPSTISEAAADPAVAAGQPRRRTCSSIPRRSAGALSRRSSTAIRRHSTGGASPGWRSLPSWSRFLIGGLALVFGPTWWLFWTAAAIAAVGGLLALAINIFDDWY